VNRLTTAIRNGEFANEFACRIVDVDSVTYTSIDVSVGVRMDAIWEAIVAVSEQLSVGKSFAINVVSVYCCRVREIVLECVQC
jgi:hypothetical protein